MKSNGTNSFLFLTKGYQRKKIAGTMKKKKSKLKSYPKIKRNKRISIQVKMKRKNKEDQINSNILMEFMLKSIKLSCWIFILSSKDRLNSLVLFYPLSRIYSICSSLMVPFSVLKMKFAPYCSIYLISSLVRALFFWEFFCCWITILSKLSLIFWR